MEAIRLTQAQAEFAQAIALPESELQVRGTVFAVLPAYSHAKVRTHAGDQYSITSRTTGVAFDQLSEGLDVELTVSSGAFPRVLSVRVVA